MQYRDTEEAIYKAVRKDTKDLFKKMEWTEKKIDSGVELENISNSLRQAIVDKGLEFAPDKEEVKEALVLAETAEDYMLCIKHWMGRLLLAGRTLNSHYYSSETHEYKLEMEVEDNGTLGLHLFEKVKKGDEFFAMYEWRVELSGKPSRVLAKVFGQELITYMCQSYPIKANKLELQLSRVYIPELYMMIANGEGHTSCMSKPHDEYDLPSNAHPTLAYENSSNAVMALLYSTGKKRHVARAICLMEGGGLAFSNSYGAAGHDKNFRDLGLTYSHGDMMGLELSKVYTEGELLVPYVDGNTQLLDDRGGCLVVDDEGEVEGSYETGRELSGHVCDHCDDRTSEELTHAENDRNVCNDCRDNDYVWVDNALYHYEDTVYCESEGEYILGDDAGYCDYREEHYRDNEEMVEVKREGQRYSNTIALRNLTDALDDWNIEEIDGQDVNTYLGIEPDEPEEEEAA